MPIWGQDPSADAAAAAAAAQATANTALSNAATALSDAATTQSGADASMKIAANGGDAANSMLFRSNIGAMPMPSRPATAGASAVLSGRPFTVSMTNLSIAKDIWRYAPLRLDTPWTIAGLAVNTTIAAALGTAAMLFGLFEVDSAGKPAARHADYSSFGSINLTALPGELVLATPGLVIPAGEWFVGFGWAGTAATAPTMSVVTSCHPIISSATASTTQAGYSQAVSGASVMIPTILALLIGAIPWPPPLPPRVGCAEACCGELPSGGYHCCATIVSRPKLGAVCGDLKVPTPPG